MPVVDVDPVWRRRQHLAPVERGEGPRNDRPHVRVGGRFAGEVSGVEFLEGGVDLVDVEQDAGRELAFGVDFDEAEHLTTERLGPPVSTREKETTEGEALSARC